MTTVVGCKDHTGAIWLGADTRSVGGRFIFPEVVDKFITHGRWTLGQAGVATTLSLLRRRGAAIAEAATAEDVVDIVHGLFKEADYRRRPDDGGAPDYSQAFIASDGEGLWGIAPDGAVWVPSWGFVAIGSGADYAYGAAWTLRRRRMGGARLALAALEAAVQFDCCTGGDFWIGPAKRETAPEDSGPFRVDSGSEAL